MLPPPLPSMTLIGLPSTELLHFCWNTLCDLDFLTLESCHVMPLGWSHRPINRCGWSTPVQSLKWIWLTFPLQSYGDNFPLAASLTVPIFTFFGGKRVRFRFSDPQKALPWPERLIMTGLLSMHGVCPKMWPVALLKNQKNSCVKLPIRPDHPRRHSPLKFCMRGRVRKVVI